MNRPVPKGYPGHHLDTAPLSDNIRALSTAERAWIQTFPKDFKFVGSKTDVEQMIGNAVPVKLAEFVANALLHHIHQKENANKGVKQLFEACFVAYRNPSSHRNISIGQREAFEQIALSSQLLYILETNRK